jgi:hypothetical protein
MFLRQLLPYGLQHPRISLSGTAVQTTQHFAILISQRLILKMHFCRCNAPRLQPGMDSRSIEGTTRRRAMLGSSRLHQKLGLDLYWVLGGGNRTYQASHRLMIAWTSGYQLHLRHSSLRLDAMLSRYFQMLVQHRRPKMSTHCVFEHCRLTWETVPSYIAQRQLRFAK